MCGVKAMFDIFKIFNKPQKSKDMAKDRLKMVLVHDRAGVSPALLENIKDEIMQVLRKYMDVSAGDFQFNLTQVDGEDGRVPALVANIPLLHMEERQIE